MTVTQDHPGLHTKPLLGIALLAALLRVCNLGTFSLWLDEVLIMERARGSLVDTWVACMANAEHPPLPALVMSVGNGLGLSDTAQALLPIALGVGTVVLLARWAGTLFGRRVGLAVGCLAAVSPLHIRYSQELRPYSYLLFFAALTLVLAERVFARQDWRSVAALGAAVTGGLYSHIQFPLVFVPILVLLVQRAWSPDEQKRTRARRALVRCAVAAAGALVAYLPWLAPSVMTLASRSPAGDVASWTWHLAGERWEFLTVAARYGDDLSVGGVMMLVLAVVGVGVGWRTPAGRAALVAAIVGSVGVELGLVAACHWTHGRYDLMAWPFLVVLAALGLDRVLTLVRLRVLAVAILAAVCVVHVRAIDTYQRIGRPSWDRMAEVVQLVRRPGEPLLVENLQCSISLGYYLDRLGGSGLPVSVDGDVARLDDLRPEQESCLLIVGRHPASSELRAFAKPFPLLVEYFNTARLYRLPLPRSDLGSGGWPPPALQLLPAHLQGQPRGCFGRLVDAVVGTGRPADTRRLDFDVESTAGALGHGWSGFERNSAGETFVWAEATEAALRISRSHPSPFTLRLRLWPHAVPGMEQRIRGSMNGSLLGEAVLRPGPQEFAVDVLPSQLKVGDNLLVLQFAHAVAPADLRLESRDRRTLAAAFDWIEIADGRELSPP